MFKIKQFRLKIDGSYITDTAIKVATFGRIVRSEGLIVLKWLR
jgi:hypothetical protein